MTLRKMISKVSGISEERIPGSFQIVGDIILAKFMPKKNLSLREKRKIASVCLEVLPTKRTFCEIRGVEGEFRKPSVRVLAGEKNTETIHKEHGIAYCIDVSKTMFSKGNLSERKRIIGKIKKGEIVVDMFAGIGYFTLGISKFSRAKEVVAIEKNPNSFVFLEKNIEINKLKNITPILGDCRKVAMRREFQGIANRVLMGYLPKTCKFLPYAFRFLKPRGIIHYHDTYHKKELWDKPVKKLEKYAKKSGFKIRILDKRIIKSYAPNVFHIVLDAEVDRK